MLGEMWLNIGSIVFGLIAWILPFVKLTDNKKRVFFSVVSFCACSISLCLVIFSIKYRVEIEDWSALMDTVPAFALVSAVLLVGTIVFNLPSFIITFGKQSKNDSSV